MKISAPLLVWFRRHRRDLPWRRNRTPYAVAVSELMLQQTQVATVIPYFNRWMQTFPDWFALARAPFPKVLKHWEGLGYYSRARNLHRLAQWVVREENGRLPSDPSVLRKLPGIGPYTAGAISSLAFGKRAPILDGNIIRVFTRLLNLSEDVRLPSTQKKLWQLAESLLPGKNCGEHNEALMELGALICTPKNPDCPHCPLQRQCQTTTPDSLPVKSRPKKILQTEHIALIKKNNLWWMEPAGSLRRFHGFWRFPNYNEHSMTPGEILCRFTYSITRHQIRLTALHARWKNAPEKTNDGKWLTLREIQKKSLPSAHRRILSLLTESSSTGDARLAR